MFALSAMVMADNATRHHVHSARPKARTQPERPPRQRRATMRELTATALHRLADRLEPHRVDPEATTS
jgi:hypothetical protein